MKAISSDDAASPIVTASCYGVPSLAGSSESIKHASGRMVDMLRDQARSDLHSVLTLRADHVRCSALAQLAIKKTKAEMKPIERVMPSISYIVARSNPGGVIGCENELPWRLRTDMKFFRSVTEGHVVIMGRKTLESLGKPLPKRVNIVLSSKKGQDSDQLLWAESLETALYLADFLSIIKGKPQIMVIGGAQIYKLFHKLFTKIYLTEVHHKFECGDAYFNEKFDLREWEILQKQEFKASEFDQYDFDISILERKIKFTRHRKLEDFYSTDHADRTRRDLEIFKEKFIAVKKSGQIEMMLPLLVA